MNPRPRTETSEVLRLQAEGLKAISEDHDALEERVRKLEQRSAWLTGALAALGVVMAVVEVLTKFK